MNQKEALMIAFTIFFTVIGWIFADLYHASNKSQLGERNALYEKSIKVKVPLDVINVLEGKQ